MTRRLRAAALLLPLLAVTLSACSGDDEGAEPQPTVTVTETVTPSADPTSATPTPSPSEAPPTDEPTEEPTPDVDLSQPATTYDEALAHVDAAEGAEQELSRFETPDGIYCVLDDDFLPPSCELMTGAVPAPDVCGSDGPSQSVGRIELTDGDPQPVCNSDTIREPGAPSLDVTGVATSSVTSITCVVETPGVTCIDPTAGQGFFLGAGQYEVFAA